MTTSSAKLRRRGPPPCFYPRDADSRRLLAWLDRTEPKTGAARLIYAALEREGAG